MFLNHVRHPIFRHSSELFQSSLLINYLKIKTPEQYKCKYVNKCTLTKYTKNGLILYIIFVYIYNVCKFKPLQTLYYRFYWVEIKTKHIFTERNDIKLKQSISLPKGMI